MIRIERQVCSNVKKNFLVVGAIFNRYIRKLQRFYNNSKLFSHSKTVSRINVVIYKAIIDALT